MVVICKECKDPLPDHYWDPEQKKWLCETCGNCSTYYTAH